MSYQLIDHIQQLGHPQILVIGDVILDRYVWGDAERISQEAPVILLREQKQEIRLGGAANVANMLRGLEVEVVIAGVVGTDVDGQAMKESLEEVGVNCAGLIEDASRPTTVKERYLGRAQHRHPHQMLRVDREVRTPLNAQIEQELLDVVLPLIPQCQAVLLSDYAKGVCTRTVLQAVVKAAKKASVPVIGDPPSSGDFSHYQGVTAVTPNRLETQRATGHVITSSEEAYAAGKKLCALLDLEYAFVTLDSDGIALVERSGESRMLPTRKREVYDITGAGDMVLATIGVGAAAGVSPVDLAKLANVAGGLEVEHVGVVTVTRDQMIADLLAAGRHTSDKVASLSEVARHVKARRRLGQRIVLTNGCFDVLHVGHVTYLQQAADEGDCLVVALNSDESVRALEKGPDRPIFGQEHRATMLAALEAVDYVVIFSEATPHRVIEQIRPDLLVKGGTYSREEIVGWELVEHFGGQAKPLSVVEGMSSTQILTHIRSDNEQTPLTLPISDGLAPESDRKAG